MVPMSDMADFTVEERGGKRVIAFAGDLRLANIGLLPKRLSEIGPVDVVDLSAVKNVDTIGAWLIHRAVAETADLIGAKPDVKALIGQVAASDKSVRMRPESITPFARVLGEIGDATAITGRTLLGLLGFFGAVLVAFFNVLRHPGRFRFNAVVEQFENVGVKALAIIGLMSFLIGIVIAQQGAVQLRQFGAEIYTINLIGRLTTRELGVLMTAIMVAGRSGSAFAAQLGTMKLTEEIDAMRTIGVSPAEVLVLPRILSSVFMMILLAFYATVLAMIGGGLFCWISLGIPPVTFIQRLREVIPMTDVGVGLVKAPVFGAIIGLTGCFQGMLVEGNSEEVGRRTTSAVVQAIFLVIVLDAFFAVFFTQIGWT
jgi:phospholipid/cholesterol/gamma-HCH transport system permease protein